MEIVSSTSEERTRSSTRPEGSPMMLQTWANLLFLHWPIDASELHTYLPEGIAIDTWGGNAWITITPLQISNLRPPFLPAIPYFSEMNELNLRTYVSMEGVPGVWFFSLDANHLLAVAGANALFSLPYFYADIDAASSHDGSVRFKSIRWSDRSRFEAAWRRSTPAAPAATETLDHFLVERYCLYTESSGRLYRARIHHRPWLLSSVSDLSLANNLLDKFGLSDVASDPELVRAGETLTVEVWPLERLP